MGRRQLSAYAAPRVPEEGLGAVNLYTGVP
jgi:hypothetical protein